MGCLNTFEPSLSKWKENFLYFSEQLLDETLIQRTDIISNWHAFSDGFPNEIIEMVIVTYSIIDGCRAIDSSVP